MGCQRGLTQLVAREARSRRAACSGWQERANCRLPLASCQNVNRVAIYSLSLSKTSSGWRLTENRATLLVQRGIFSGSLVGRLSIYSGRGQRSRQRFGHCGSKLTFCSGLLLRDFRSASATTWYSLVSIGCFQRFAMRWRVRWAARFLPASPIISAASA
jgi:hypothetical protein